MRLSAEVKAPFGLRNFWFEFAAALYLVPLFRVVLEVVPTLFLLEERSMLFYYAEPCEGDGVSTTLEVVCLAIWLEAEVLDLPVKFELCYRFSVDDYVWWLLDYTPLRMVVVVVVSVVVVTAEFTEAVFVAYVVDSL